MEILWTMGNSTLLWISSIDSIYIYIYIYIYMCVCVYIYVYIYIFPNLISTSIHRYQKKREKNRQEQEIKYLESPPGGKKKKYYRTKRKKRPTPSRPLKNQEICSQLVKRKLKPSVNTAMLQITRVLNASGANYKINLNRESEISY